MTRRGGRSGGRAGGNPSCGHQSGRLSSSGRVLPPVFVAAGDQAACCGLCNVVVGSDAVGCDRCDRWFHPSVLCMGIPESVIENIKQYGGGGISYICTVCRSGSSTGGDTQNSALSQLLLTVAKLCETVQKLSDKVDGLLNGSVDALRPHPSSDQLRALVSEECREMEERKKRLSSIIIRGVNARSPAALSPIFDSITTELVGSQIQLSDVVCINADRGLFRARVTDVESRQKLLDSAKNLKNSPLYSTVYINKDLTYKQRQSLIARRTRSLDNNGNHLPGGDTTIPPVGSGAAAGDARGAPGRAGLRSGGVAGDRGPLN